MPSTSASTMAAATTTTVAPATASMTATSVSTAGMSAMAAAGMRHPTTHGSSMAIILRIAPPAIAVSKERNTTTPVVAAIISIVSIIAVSTTPIAHTPRQETRQTRDDRDDEYSLDSAALRVRLAHSLWVFPVRPARSAATIRSSDTRALFDSVFMLSYNKRSTYGIAMG